MKKIIQPQMDTDGHGFRRQGSVRSLSVLSVSIRVHPWLKKNWLVWLSFIFWLFTAADAGAQLAPADDFFHGGAQLYITNNIPAAKEVVAQGRKLYPDDEKLKKLEELLNQKQQQQQQSQDDQQKKSDGQQSQQQQEQKDPQQKKDEEKKQADQKKEEEQKKAEQKKNSAEKPKDESQEKQEAQPVKPGEMTPEEAKRLLDGQKGKEQLLQLKPPEKPRNNSRPVKDW